MVVRTFTPEKSFGTILVGIGFASYLVPVLKPEVEVTPSHKDKSHVKYTTKRVRQRGVLVSHRSPRRSNKSANPFWYFL